MKAQAIVSALDYLDGLVVILERLAEQGVGRGAPSPLLNALQGMDSGEMSWEPLRYQATDGQGWAYVAENVRDLRERLLDNYGEAALS